MRDKIGLTVFLTFNGGIRAKLEDWVRRFGGRGRAPHGAGFLLRPAGRRRDASRSILRHQALAVR